jgi:hypothetical protein
MRIAATLLAVAIVVGCKWVLIQVTSARVSSIGESAR